MRNPIPAIVLLGTAFAGCSLLLGWPESGRRCDEEDRCLDGYLCENGRCRPGDESSDAAGGDDGSVDAGPGDPVLVGCADGKREGFTDLARFPRIAGCAATFLRLVPCPGGATGSMDGVHGCAACGAGWHVCSVPPGDLSTCPSQAPGASYVEVRNQVTYDECKAQPGIFAAGAVFAESAYGCGISTGGQRHYGCGTETGGWTGTTGNDCTLFIPGVNCYDNKACLSAGISQCQGFSDAGTFPSYRGVMCCKD